MPGGGYVESLFLWDIPLYYDLGFVMMSAGWGQPSLKSMAEKTKTGVSNRGRPPKAVVAPIQPSGVWKASPKTFFKSFIRGLRGESAK